MQFTFFFSKFSYAGPNLKTRLKFSTNEKKTLPNTCSRCKNGDMKIKSAKTQHACSACIAINEPHIRVISTR